MNYIKFLLYLVLCFLLEDIRAVKNLCSPLFVFKPTEREWQGVLTVNSSLIRSDSRVRIALYVDADFEQDHSEVSLNQDINSIIDDKENRLIVKYVITIPQSLQFNDVKFISIDDKIICNGPDLTQPVFTFEITQTKHPPVRRKRQTSSENWLNSFSAMPVSDCPNILEFYQSGFKWYGLITIPTEYLWGRVFLDVTVQFTKNAMEIPGNGVHLTKTEKNAYEDAKHLMDVQYDIIFPESSVLPHISSIKVNNKELCHSKDLTGAYTFRMNHTYEFAQRTDEEKFRGRSQRNKGNWLSNFRFESQCGDVLQEGVKTIIGGMEVTRGRYPWLVAIFKPPARIEDFICGGTLVSDRHVISAAHCVLNLPQVELNFGIHELEKVDRHVARRKSNRILNHPEYRNGTAHCDIALIFFDQVDFSDYIKPICLWPHGKSLVSFAGIVTGWGQDESGTNTDVPYETRVLMVSQKTCTNKHELLKSIISSQTFCAGGEKAGPCFGDSGGGMYLLQDNHWYLRGVVSTSVGSGFTCNTDTYAVYADVAQFLDWLEPYLTVT